MVQGERGVCAAYQLGSEIFDVDHPSHMVAAQAKLSSGLEIV